MVENMTALERHLAEMKRLKTAFNNTDSARLKNNYAKAIRKMQQELREYCGYKGLDYKKLMREL